MNGLIILAGLNIVLGVCVFIISYRLFALRTRVSEMEERISRLEVVIELSMTKPEKVPQQGPRVLGDRSPATQSLAGPVDPQGPAGASRRGKSA